MKLSPNARGVKMFLHLVSISIFSVPITTHILKLALGQTFSIGSFDFTKIHSILLIGLILLLISANIFSIITDKGHKISMLVTGGFLFGVTLIQIGVLVFRTPMKVFGNDWPEHVSIIETAITGVFSGLLLFNAAFIDKVQHKATNITLPRFSFPSFTGSIRAIREYIGKMEGRSAFLLGIAGSMLLVIPACAGLYLIAYLLLRDTFLTLSIMKLLAWIGIVGMQGSIISMFLGLRRFNKQKNDIDAFGLFLNALVRPFIGFSFAHLSFFMLESGLLQDASLQHAAGATSGDGLIYSFNYHVSVAFIAGFTERIAKVIQPGSGESKETSNPKKLADGQTTKGASKQTA